MQKTIKIPTIAPTCFGSRRNHHQGAISCLAKTTIMILLCSSLTTWSKIKGKGRFMGLFNTAAVRPIVFLPPTSSRIHLQRRHASYSCAGPLTAKAGTITNEFC